MKKLTVIVAYAVLGYFGILLMPLLIAQIAVAEYKAHAWYCGRTGGHIEHVYTFRNSNLDESCDYP